MKIESAISIRGRDLIPLDPPEHLFLYYFNGAVLGMRWSYHTSDRELRGMVKRAGGEWDSGEKLWVLPKESRQEMVDIIIKRHPDWPVLTEMGDGESGLVLLAGMNFSFRDLREDKAALLLPHPLPLGIYLARPNSSFISKAVKCAKLTCNPDEFALLVGKKQDIHQIASRLMANGATDAAECDHPHPIHHLELDDSSKVKIKVSGWAVQIQLDFHNPLHYLVERFQRSETIHTTRKDFSTWWKARLEEAGLQYEGDDPEAPLATPVQFDTLAIPGWATHASNGFMLHHYQKKGVAFGSKRGMRALIGDEMGVGKTAQAIAAAAAIKARRVLIVCPANARYVWEREIVGWGTPLRNNEHEAAVLLSLLDPDAAQTLDKKKGYVQEQSSNFSNHEGEVL